MSNTFKRTIAKPMWLNTNFKKQTKEKIQNERDSLTCNSYKGCKRAIQTANTDYKKTYCCC